MGLVAAAAELLRQARTTPAGRAARTLVGGAGAPLSQTLLALVRGASLAEHDSPGAATVQLLQGRVLLVAGDDRWDLVVGDHVPLPPRRHGLECLDDAVVLLTAAAGQGR